MKNKKFLIIFLILLIITIIFYQYTDNLNIKIQDNITISLNSEAYNTDYLDLKYTQKVKKELIDTTKLGPQDITIIVKNIFGKSKEYTYSVTITDNISPTITYQEEIITIIGLELDLISNAIIEDNSNEDIKLEIKGEYDFNKKGTYNLTYIAKDSSNNITEEQFVLKVKTPKEAQNDIITFKTSKGYEGIIKNGITYIDGTLIVNKSFSLPSDYGESLTEETKEAYNQMKAAATLEGLNIYLSSGYRSYKLQSKIYKRYIDEDGQTKADTYSARPGHSEHQSGLAFDVNQVNDTFNDSAEAKWLANNCYKYGLILRYPKGKTNETGYKYESWHFRYVGIDLATKLYNNGDWITLESYYGINSEY